MFNKVSRKEMEVEVTAVLDLANYRANTNKERIAKLSDKIDLILEHLELRYVEERTTTEAAKLEEDKVLEFINDTTGFILSSEDAAILADASLTSGGSSSDYHCPVSGCDFSSKKEKGVKIHMGRAHK